MKLHRLSVIALFAWMSLAASAQAEVKPAPLFTDHMVLQRDQAIPVWGWDKPGQQVQVQLGDANASAKADADGKWMVKLPMQKANSKPQELVVKGSSSVTLKDVLIGEVWLCSGQSNMEWTVGGSDNAKEEIAKANHPRIRHIKIPHVPAAKPQETVKTSGWQVCSPKTVSAFTGVGYFFGRELEKELDVPIGLIGSNWGGTRIEPWTTPEGFKSVPALKSISDKLDSFPTRNGERVNHQSPLALYNGMIHPLVPYALRGAIWYQGESNRGEGLLYLAKMKALINGWRKIWGEDMPFYFVQLAPYRYGGKKASLADAVKLAEIWEAQLLTLDIPNTGMAVTTDVTNLDNIHPRNKQDVGKRLALWALANTYGKKNLVHSGPLYDSMKVEGDKIRISFKHTGGGLAARDGKPLSWFTIAGDDGKFVEAKAEVDGNTVLVHADAIKKPAAVRFGWHQEAEPNLINKEGLPASPFRTDRKSKK